MNIICSYINCFISIILDSLLIYTFTINWWKIKDNENIYYQSLIYYDKIGHSGSIEIVKALFYSVIILNLIILYIILYLFIQKSYLYFISFLINLSGMILITAIIPQTEIIDYQSGFIIGWIIIGIKFIMFLVNLLILSFYKKKSIYQEIV